MTTKATSKPPRLGGTITTQCKAALEFVQKELKLNGEGDTVAALLVTYREHQKLLKEVEELKSQLQEKSNPYGLSNEELEVVNNAVIESGMTFEQLVKRGLLKEARTALSVAKRDIDLSETDPEKLKKMTFKGVASARIDHAVNKISDYNDRQGENKDRYFISASLIAKLTGSNRNAVKEFFNSYKLIIDAINDKYTLTNDDNRKGKGIDAKQLLGL